MTTLLLNLKTEMLRNRLTAREIAKKIGMNESGLSERISEKKDFKRGEMYAIASLFPGVSMEYLFKTDGNY